MPSRPSRRSATQISMLGLPLLACLIPASRATILRSGEGQALASTTATATAAARLQSRSKLSLGGSFKYEKLDTYCLDPEPRKRVEEHLKGRARDKTPYFSLETGESFVKVTSQEYKDGGHWALKFGDYESCLPWENPHYRNTSGCKPFLSKIQDAEIVYNKIYGIANKEWTKRKWEILRSNKEGYALFERCQIIGGGQAGYSKKKENAFPQWFEGNILMDWCKRFINPLDFEDLIRTVEGFEKEFTRRLEIGVGNALQTLASGDLEKRATGYQEHDEEKVSKLIRTSMHNYGNVLRKKLKDFGMKLVKDKNDLIKEAQKLLEEKKALTKVPKAVSQAVAEFCILLAQGQVGIFKSLDDRLTYVENDGSASKGSGSGASGSGGENPNAIEEEIQGKLKENSVAAWKFMNKVVANDTLWQPKNDISWRRKFIITWALKLEKTKSKKWYTDKLMAVYAYRAFMRYAGYSTAHMYAPDGSGDSFENVGKKYAAQIKSLICLPAFWSAPGYAGALANEREILSKKPSTEENTANFPLSCVRFAMAQMVGSWNVAGYYNLHIYKGWLNHQAGKLKTGLGMKSIKTWAANYNTDNGVLADRELAIPSKCLANKAFNDTEKEDMLPVNVNCRMFAFCVLSIAKNICPKNVTERNNADRQHADELQKNPVKPGMPAAKYPDQQHPKGYVQSSNVYNELEYDEAQFNRQSGQLSDHYQLTSESSSDQQTVQTSEEDPNEHKENTDFEDMLNKELDGGNEPSRRSSVRSSSSKTSQINSVSNRKSQAIPETGQLA